MNIDILVISETKKKGSGIEEIDEVMHCWSGVKKEERAKAGVGILVKKKWKKKITSWEPINERIIKLNITMLGKDMVILGVYGPTEDSTIREKDNFMETLEIETQKVKKNQELIIMGDLNGRTGRKTKDNTVGPFGEDITNDNGERLIELCELNGLKITNGFYKHKDIHKYTWMQETRNLKSIIDYIIIKNDTTIKIKDVRVKRGAECGTDHRLLIANIKVPWYKTIKQKETIDKENRNTNEITEKADKEIKYKIHLLQDETIRDLYRRRLDQKLNEFNYDNLQQMYDHIKECIKQASLEALGKEDNENEKHKIRICEKTKESIKEKKRLYEKWLNTKSEEDLQKYKEKNAETRRMINKEKNERWEKSCEHVEQYIGGTRSTESWRIIKALRTNNREKTYIEYIPESEWEEYYKKLLTEDRQEFQEENPEEEQNKEIKEIELSYEEVKKTIKTLKNNKSAGPGGVVNEMIKYGSNKLHRMLRNMFHRAINGEKIPEEWSKAYIVSIFKKGDRRKCTNYRGLSIISSMGRLYGKIIKNIMEENIKGKIGEDQAGFTAGKSCIDHIYTIKQTMEKKLAKNREVHLAFIDIRKAYDSVPRQRLWNAMKEIGIDKELIYAVKALYENNTVNIKIGHKIGKRLQTSKGLLQGCSTSPTLFKIYLEQTLKKWKQKCSGMGVPIREDYLYTLSFADDQVIIAQDEEDLSYMVRKLKEEYTKAGLAINFDKTEYLTTKEGNVENLEVDNETIIKGTDRFKYLGTIISKNATSEEEIKARLGQTRTCIRQLNSILWDKHITKRNKTRIYKSIIQSIMTYGSETWTINKRNKSKINAVEMEYWRRCCRVTRMERITNEEIRSRMNIKENAINTIEEKRLKWYGHIRRSEDNRWIKKITEWSPIGRRKRGRPRRSWRDDVDEAMEDRGLTDGDWEDRNGWNQRLREGRQRQL